MKEFRSSYLIQRLCKPIGRVNPFSFGGGLVNGGLSDNAMKLLTPLFSFDYMGAAEFEWGAIPKFFQGFAKNVEKFGKWEININKTPIYVIGMTERKDLINERLIELSKGKGFTKEFVGLDQACGLSKWTKKEDCRYIGWLELDNTFMFFTDKKAYDGVCSLFEITEK